MFNFHLFNVENFNLVGFKNINVNSRCSLPEKCKEQLCRELRGYEKQLFDILTDRKTRCDRTEEIFDRGGLIDAFSRYSGGRPLRHLAYDCESKINKAFDKYCRLDKYGHGKLKEILHVKHARTFNGKVFCRPKSFEQFLDSSEFEFLFKAYDESFAYNKDAMDIFQEKVVKVVNQLQLVQNDFKRIEHGVNKLHDSLVADGYKLPCALAYRMHQMKTLSHFFASHYYVDTYLNNTFWREECRASNYVLFVTFYFHLYENLMGDYVCENTSRLIDKLSL